MKMRRSYGRRRGGFAAKAARRMQRSSLTYVSKRYTKVEVLRALDG